MEDDDALLLATGEVLLGFVETVGAKAIGFMSSAMRTTRLPIPLERIAGLSIANKPKPAEREGRQTLLRVDLPGPARVLSA